MDMKKILQAIDGANIKAEVQSSDMKKFLTIVEGKGPLNRPTSAESITMQHYIAPVKKTTSVQEDIVPSVISKYVDAVEQELREAAERPNVRATELSKRIIAGMNEGWSQKYKSSINCSHPKGFSQKAHCAGKKKHTESMMTMESVCPDCGMCETHGSLNEIAKGAKDSNGVTKCWPGKHAAGTKKGRNGGQVRNCVPNESQGVAEGLKQTLRKFDPTIKARIRQKSQDQTNQGIDTIQHLADLDLTSDDMVSRAMKPDTYFKNAERYAKLANKGVAEGEKHGLYYNVNKRKAAGTSRPASSPKAPTAQAWKDAAKTAKKEDVAESEKRMSRAAKGYEKYGKAGMTALAKAGREGASEKTLDTIRDKHDKYNEAANPAQQAAIAIAKKKAGKK